MTGAESPVLDNLPRQEELRSGNWRKARMPWATIAVPVAIFIVAFALRAAYILFGLEHRVCHYGDAYNFLRTGSGILELLTSAANPAGVWQNFCQLIAHSHADAVQALGSTSLPERLLVDGPVYPAYLAFAEWASGVNPHHPLFEGFAQKLCLLNAAIDALTCVLIYCAGRIAFGRTSGIAAALLFAIYPGAIINTQHCYCEPFVYFLLSGWTALLLLLANKPQTKNGLSLWFVLGITTGLLMLSKPSFVLLPLFVGAVWLAVAAAGGRKRIAETFSPLKLSAAILAAALILAPWAAFNTAVTGKTSIFVSRAPWFNLWQGNITSWDGWNEDPDPVPFPGKSDAVVAGIMHDAKAHPLEFAGLEMRKVARLWAGVWNDYQYDLFGLPLGAQSIVHQVFLLLAALGGVVLLASRRLKDSAEVTSALLLFSIVAFHFTYIAFETRYRYGSTALPMVAILAGYLLTRAWQVCAHARIQLIVTIAVAALVFAGLPHIHEPITAVVSMLPANLLAVAPWLEGLLAIICLCIVCDVSSRLVVMLVPADRRVPAVRALLLLLLPAALVLGACHTLAPDWRQWSTNLLPNQALRQDVRLPADLVSDQSASTAFLLFDADAQCLPPPIKFSLNGRELKTTAFPIAQVQSGNGNIIECLSIQGQAMGKDMRSFRQWWVVPVPIAFLKPGAANSIVARASVNSPPVKFFGDYSTGAAQIMPSINSFAYTKGFVTWPQDPRIMKAIHLHGLNRSDDKDTGAQMFDGQAWNKNDLSDAPGRQIGRYRLHLIMCRDAQLSAAASRIDPLQTPIAMLKLLQAQHIAAAENPLSMQLPGGPYLLPANLPLAARFRFSARIKGIKSLSSPYIAVEFSGTDKREGKPVSWHSQWQPTAIAVSSDWQSVSFEDALPDEIRTLDALKASVMISPFQSDLYFLNPKKAARCKVAVSEVTLTILPPLSLPPAEQRKWDLF